MELTREIYWNVGHSVLIPMYLLVTVAFAILVFGLKKRLTAYRIGKPLDRTDQPAERISGMLRDIFLQSRVMRVKGAGSAHGIFFFGFILLTIGTTLVFIQADILDPLFGVRFLTGGFYLLFSVVLDLAGLAAILMLIGLGVRRYLLGKELPTVADNALMLILLLVILVSGFAVEGTRMAATEMGTSLANWSPIGLLFAQPLAGMSEEALRSLHSGLWWFHFALVLGFFCAIPFTRFRHMVLTPANIFFRDLGPTGKLTTPDLEDEEAESFGASTLADLSWKDIFDGDACTYCQRCQDRCPAWNTDKPLSPMKLVNQIQEQSFNNPEGNLIETVTTDVLWSCTTCRACQDICPAAIEHVPKIIEMRRNLVLMEGEFPGEEVTKAMENTEVNGNPLGMAPATRADWLKNLGGVEGLEVADLGNGEEAEILYFVGCYASFDKRNQKIAQSFIKLCSAAGVKVGILGKEEKCCGEPMRKMGNEYLYQMMAAENIELIKASGVKKVVSACPHCFNTLAKDYVDLGLELPVEHANSFLAELLEADSLKLKPQTLDCTYHDSCYLGRHNDLYDAPRHLLKAAGAEVREMENSREESFCCSAGGGRILAEENIGERMNQARARMAAETGAPTLVSSCPFCMSMFEDGIKGADLDEKLKPIDLLEVLAERIES